MRARLYQINVNDKEYTVEVEDLNASPVTVRVNGKAFEVTIAEQTTRPQPARGLAGEPEETFVPVVAATSVTMPIGTPIEPEPDAPSPPAPSGALGEGGQPITAPMPGKVMDIIVQVGDPIKQGDTLCNLEAMKMKSPIRSPSDGTIAQILISEGQNVSYGDVLFTLS